MYPPDRILRTPLYRQLSSRTLGASIPCSRRLNLFIRRKLMQFKVARAVCILAALAMVVPAFGQYGYPLKGTFTGDWWIEKGKENHLLVEFNYEGDKDLVTGTYSPGPE